METLERAKQIAHSWMQEIDKHPIEEVMAMAINEVLVDNESDKKALKEKVTDWFAEVSAATIVPHYSLQDAYEYRDELESLFNE